MSRLEVSRQVPATPEAVFAVLRDPQGHVAIDSSGMLQAATGEPVSAVGDVFTVHMDREALGDRPMGEYDVEVHLTAYDAPREIAWTIVGTVKPPIGHVYGYRLQPVEDGTLVTSYYDWSQARPDLVEAGLFPVIPEQALKATLGILARTVARGQAGTASSSSAAGGAS